jgi:hypothetical protein
MAGTVQGQEGASVRPLHRQENPGKVSGVVKRLFRKCPENGDHSDTTELAMLAERFGLDLYTYHARLQTILEAEKQGEVFTVRKPGLSKGAK